MKAAKERLLNARERATGRMAGRVKEASDARWHPVQHA